MVKSVAVIGVGAMGGPMARRIAGGGFDLTVCDRSNDALRAFEGDAVTTTRPADCAAADLILILVVTADQVREVVLGDNGITSGLTPEHSPLVAVMSTIGQTPVVELQEQLNPLGVRLIDSPISGGAVRAGGGARARGGGVAAREGGGQTTRCQARQAGHGMPWSASVPLRSSRGGAD